MDWIIGPSISNVACRFDVFSGDGQIETAAIDVLARDSLLSPGRRSRLLYVGDFAAWAPSCETDYLQAFGLQLPTHIDNRHVVFSAPTQDGPTIHVPALVLLRALFRPMRLLHPVIFSPGNIDLLAFVDYASSPPQVVFDMLDTRHLERRWVGSQHQALRWLHSSISARSSAQSVYMNALQGLLNLSLPVGQVRMALHGLKIGNDLYVTKASLVWAKVIPMDSISGQEQTFVFNANVDEEREVFASSHTVRVPLHPNGLSFLTDDEWQAIEPLLQGKRIRATMHSRRALLDAMLHKIASGIPWKKVPRDGFAVTDLTATFRRWVADGRLINALRVLEASRGPTVTDSGSRSENSRPTTVPAVKNAAVQLGVKTCEMGLSAFV